MCVCVCVCVQESKASIVGDELLADMLQQMEVHIHNSVHCEPSDLQSKPGSVSSPSSTRPQSRSVFYILYVYVLCVCVCVCVCVRERESVCCV